MTPWWLETSVFTCSLRKGVWTPWQSLETNWQLTNRLHWFTKLFKTNLKLFAFMEFINIHCLKQRLLKVSSCCWVNRIHPLEKCDSLHRGRKAPPALVHSQFWRPSANLMAHSQYYRLLLSLWTTLWSLNGVVYLQRAAAFTRRICIASDKNSLWHYVVSVASRTHWQLGHWLCNYHDALSAPLLPSLHSNITQTASAMWRP